MAWMMVCPSTITRSTAPNFYVGSHLPPRWGSNGAAMVPSQRADPSTGADTGNRMLFEVRIVGDTVVPGQLQQIGSREHDPYEPERIASTRLLYHVATVYDGKEFSNYVDGVREGGAQVHLAPHGPGHASVGAAINKGSYFKGAVHLARFTRKALSPSQFLPSSCKAVIAGPSPAKPVPPRRRHQETPRAHIFTMCPAFRQSCEYPRSRLVGFKGLGVGIGIATMWTGTLVSNVGV